MSTGACFGPPLTAKQQDDVVNAYLARMSFHTIASTFRIHVKHINPTLFARGIIRSVPEPKKRRVVPPSAAPRVISTVPKPKKRGCSIVSQLEIPGSLLLILPALRTLPRPIQEKILSAYQSSAPADQLHKMFKDAQQWPQ